MDGMQMRRSARACLCACTMWLLPVLAAAAACAPDPGWIAYQAALVSPDGRVMDAATPAAITTSEGQAYGLFFALVNQDRERFDRLLDWTANNLAEGDLASHLPAWQWGRADDGQWRILDRNPASDADVWIAYVLTEAGHLWREPRYASLGRALAAQIVARETVLLPGFGQMLLPGPVGFHPSATRWRLNPSYLPVQVLRGLATRLGEPVWALMADNAGKLLTQTAARGYAPDWVLYETGHGFLPDAQSKAIGSYNAIRVYLWVAMLHPAEPWSTRLKLAFAPLHDRVLAEQAVPEAVDTLTGRVLAADGPPGFAHAVLPLLTVLADSKTARRRVWLYRQQVDAMPVSGYYNQSLRLFSQLWLQERYRFAADGTLQLSMECT